MNVNVNNRPSAAKIMILISRPCLWFWRWLFLRHDLVEEWAVVVCACGGGWVGAAPLGAAGCGWDGVGCGFKCVGRDGVGFYFCVCLVCVAVGSQPDDEEQEYERDEVGQIPPVYYALLLFGFHLRTGRP